MPTARIIATKKTSTVKQPTTVDGYCDQLQAGQHKGMTISQDVVIPHVISNLNKFSTMSGGAPNLANSGVCFDKSTNIMQEFQGRGGVAAALTGGPVNLTREQVLAKSLGLNPFDTHSVAWVQQEKIKYLQNLLLQNRQELGLLQQRRDAALHNLNAMRKLPAGMPPSFQQPVQVQQLFIVPTPVMPRQINMIPQAIQSHSDPLTNAINPTDIYAHLLANHGKSLGIKPALGIDRIPLNEKDINDAIENKPTTEVNADKSTLEAPSASPSDTDKPRRPLNAYNFFFSEEREVILAELKFALDEKSEEGQGKGEAQKNPDQTEIVKILESPPALSETQMKELRERIDSKTDQVLNTLKESERAKKPPHRKTHGIGFRPLSKVIAQRWKNLGTERRNHYKKLAKKDLDRYTKCMNDYAKKMLNKSKAVGTVH